jgi:thioredoxin
MGSEYRRLGLSSEDRLSGRGVSWCATCDGAFFRDQEIAVIGGGDSALEEAMFLTRFASKVTIVHRRDQLRASKVMIDRAMSNAGLGFLWNHEVVDILGDDRVDGLRVKDTKTGAEQRLEVTGLFVAVGHTPRSELIRGQVDLDGGGYVRVKRGSTGTNIGGVFAAGDLVDHTYRQAITAAGSGCAAALDAERFLSEIGGKRTAESAPRVERRVEASGAAPTAGSGVRTVTEANFRTEVLDSDLPVLVDFWADGCGPCRLVLPVLDEVAGEVSDRLVVAKLNVDENPETAAEYSVTSLPTMKVYQGGVVVHTIAGAKPKSMLLAELAAFL